MQTRAFVQRCQNSVVMTKLHACKLQCDCAGGTPQCKLHMLNHNTCCLQVTTCKHPMLTRSFKHVCLCVNREWWHPIGQTNHDLCVQYLTRFNASTSPHDQESPWCCYTKLAQHPHATSMCQSCVTCSVKLTCYECIWFDLSYTCLCKYQHIYFHIQMSVRIYLYIYICRCWSIYTQLYVNMCYEGKCLGMCGFTIA